MLKSCSAYQRLQSLFILVNMLVNFLNAVSVSKV